jgi:hypothetical protein
MFELNMSLMESQSAAIVFRDFVKVMVIMVDMEVLFWFVLLGHTIP